MTEDAPDSTTLTGAEFQRHVGTDPAKWAEAFQAAYDRDRTTDLAQWFRDYAEVCVAEEVGRVTARLVPRQE
jgi:hypothetical protein